MNNKLSKNYGFLKIYRGLLTISLVIYSWFTIKGITNILEKKKEMPLFKETANEMITNLVILYILILFSTFCIISIINFIFSLDDNINNIENEMDHNINNIENEMKKNKINKKKATKKENRKTKLFRKTKLLKNKNDKSIIQGRIYKILEDTIIVAHNDKEGSLIEVKNYPTKSIIDEVWVKITVRYLYTTSNLVDIVEFIEHVEKY